MSVSSKGNKSSKGISSKKSSKSSKEGKTKTSTSNSKANSPEPPVMAEVAPPEAPKAEAPAEELPPPPPPKEPRRKLVFRHWIRPTFLNYHYIYDYRHNYYDDVIDFLDRRQHGLSRDPPRAQTWAERALRTYTFKPNVNDYIYYTPFRKEEHHCYKVAHTYRAQHTKDYFSRKFKSVLY